MIERVQRGTYCAFDGVFDRYYRPVNFTVAYRVMAWGAELYGRASHRTNALPATALLSEGAKGI